MLQMSAFRLASHNTSLVVAMTAIEVVGVVGVVKFLRIGVLGDAEPLCYQWSDSASRECAR